MNAQVADPGLSTVEASKRLTQYGPNAVEDIAERPLPRLFGKISAPIPWLLEATVILEIIAFGNQATTYNNRERRHLWASWPSGWVLAASGADIAIAAILAVAGVAMHALPITVVLAALAAAAVFAVAFDFAKVPVFRRLEIA